jgi:hypothetical protein
MLLVEVMIDFKSYGVGLAAESNVTHDYRDCRCASPLTSLG